MPAFLTHWRILIETARHSQDAGNDLGSLIIDAAALHRRAHGWSTPPQTAIAGAVWDTGPLPEIDFRFPGSDISSLAFLGALAPDMLYYRRDQLRKKLRDAHLHRPVAPSSRKGHPHWSELFHHTRSGEILITFLELVALVPSPALRSQALAFALGYVSHIASDIALNPWINALSVQQTARRMPGPHTYIELRLDEYLAETYFENPRYSLFHQPWGDYIEPAARELSRTDTLLSQLLQLLASAVEVYGLDENETERLPQDFREGLTGLRRYLAGRGQARWLTIQAASRREQPDAISRVLSDIQSDETIIALNKVLTYAEQLSTHLCRRAISYYTALRNPQAEASERSSQRNALVHDLRNWNLQTGFSTESDSGENGNSHNWNQFSDLWRAHDESQAEKFEPDHTTDYLQKEAL